MLLSQQSEAYAHETCKILKDHEIFAACREVLDVTHYVESCQKDLCSDSNQNFRNFYFCNTVQAYIFECANRGITIDWMDHPDMKNLKDACAEWVSLLKMIVILNNRFITLYFLRLDLALLNAQKVRATLNATEF